MFRVVLMLAAVREAAAAAAAATVGALDRGRCFGAPTRDAPFCTCGAGEYKDYGGVDGISTCAPCAAGTFQPHADHMGSCAPCYGMTFAPEEGATKCRSCPDASSWGHGSECSDEEPAVLPPARRKVIQAPAPTINGDAQQAHGDPCPQAPLLSASNPFCTCGPGQRRRIITPGNLLQCVSCTAGKYQPHKEDHASYCLNCTAGHQAVSGTHCEACSEGTFNRLPGQGSCNDCPAGSTAPQRGSHRCTPCPRGHASNIVKNTALHCDPCDPGTFSHEIGQDSCKDCPAGYSQFMHGSFNCTPCTPGRFSKAVRSTKHPCDSCSPGFYADKIGQSACILCQAGKFQELDAAINCTLSPAGYIPTEDRADVEKCQAGTFADIPGLPECKECQPGQTQHLQGAHGCTPCARGHASGTNGNNDIHCAPCSRGRFADDLGISNCKKCSIGRFQELLGAHNCTRTHAGYFPAADRQSQLPCEKGAYADERGLEECKVCEEGRFADVVGRHLCSLCARGYAAPNKGTELCDACEPGRWSNGTGTTECASCAPGKTTDHFHAHKCDKCAPGHAQPDQGGNTEHCPVCKIGFIAPDYGAEKCVSCGLSAYTTEAGSTSCLDCLTMDAAFGLKYMDQCSITWLILIVAMGSVVLCCGCICWMKEGCPCRPCCTISRGLPLPEHQNKLSFTTVDGSRCGSGLGHQQENSVSLPKQTMHAKSAPSILASDPRKKAVEAHEKGSACNTSNGIELTNPAFASTEDAAERGA